MSSLSLILEDTPDGNIQIKFRSTRELPTGVEGATAAELVLLEIAGWVTMTYKPNDQNIIQTSPIINPNTPLIIP